MTTRIWMTLAGATMSLACSTALPPERLVSIDAELARDDVTELAETQARHIGEARQRRDAAWKAYRAGEPEQADLLAWIAWQQLRIAENLDVIGRQAAMSTARGQDGDVAAEPVSAPATLDPERPSSRSRAAVPTKTSRPPAPHTAVQAVQDAEDARLRLVATGGQRDWRWPEGEALLQTAQRALERGSFDRAEQLADRALFVFEMVRLSSAPVDGAAPAPWTAPGTPAASARTIPPPSRAYVDASIRVSRARTRAAALGCSADVETAESLLRQAESRRLAGDGGGADAQVAIANDHLKRCESLETRQVAVRITPLRETAQTLSRRLPSPIDRGRVKALLAQADAALEDGDIDSAEALLLEATGQPRMKPPVAAVETPPAAAPNAAAPPAAAPPAGARPTPPAGSPPAKAAVTAGTAPAVPTGQTTKAGPGLTVAPTLAPIIPIGGGGAAPAAEPKVSAPEPKSKVVREGPDETPAPAGPRSRILSERLEPLSPTPETPEVGPDPEAPATPNAKEAKEPPTPPK